VRATQEFEHGKSRVKDFIMQLQRPAFALHPKLFGKGPLRDLGAAEIRASLIGEDAKLFATTFVAGFLFVSILIA
jgi:hypothetical protein